MKRVTITPKPADPAKPQTPEQWVQQQPPGDQQSLKRITIDIPQSLHLRARRQCLERGVYLSVVIRDFLEREFGTEYSRSEPESSGSAMETTKPSR